MRNRLRAAAWIAIAAMAVGCGSTVPPADRRTGVGGGSSLGSGPGSNANRDASPLVSGDDTAPGASGTATDAIGAGVDQGSGTSPGTVGGGGARGVISTRPIKVGYMVADVSGAAAALGATGYDAEQQTQATRDAWKALIKHANSQGGVGGRKIEGIEYKVTIGNEQTKDVTSAAAICARATEDDKIEAMLDFDAFGNDEEALACFGRHRTPLVAQIFAASRGLLLRNRPYLATTFGLPDRAEPGLIDGLNRVGYFKGAKVGVIMDDQPIIKEIWQQKMKPQLDRLGVKVEAMHEVAPYDPGVQASQTQNAVLDFKSKGVTHVIFAANVLVLITYTQSAKNAQYYARLGLGDFMITASSAPGNAPYFPALYEGMRDAVAVTAISGIVLDDPTQKKGSTINRNNPKLLPGLRRCADVLSAQLKANYYTMSNNARARGWAYICDAFFLWWDAARKIGAGVTRQNWGTAVPQFGTTFMSTVVHRTRFSATQYDGAADYRVGVYYSDDVACLCYKALVPGYFALPAT